MDRELIQFQKAGMEAILVPDSEPFETFVFDHGWNFEEKDSDKELEAKSMFNAMKKNDPNPLAIKLAYYLGPPHYLHIRERCDLLCKLITDDGDLCTWRNLSVATQSSIKCMILDHISLNQESEFIIHQLLKTVSKLVDSLLPDNAWPELLPSLYQCVADSSSTQHLKGAACAIFATLAEDIGETTVPCVKDLHSIFLNVLNDDTLDIYLRIATTRSVITFIQCIQSSNENERYQDLLPGMMRTLTDSLSNGGLEDLAHYVLALFIDLAKNEPSVAEANVYSVNKSQLLYQKYGSY